ncbi:MAG: S8 family serine peptidase [Desulfuromonadaceae bacterium]|nr:S8 family serine peptidase [Desulfuromonadaceae bacterium]
MTRIGVIDTGINPWHSHIRGGVTGLRMYLDSNGRIREDDDFRDLVGHGTAVAGILRQQLPLVELFAVRVFEQDLSCYPSLVARAMLRAAAEGCTILNMSLGMSPGPGSELLVMACQEVMEAGCTIVAAGHPGNSGLLPASISGVLGAIADDTVPVGEISMRQENCYPYAASGSPRDLDGLKTSDNLWGNSFACARVTAYMVELSSKDRS